MKRLRLTLRITAILLSPLLLEGTLTGQILDRNDVRDRLSHLSTAVIGADTSTLPSGDRLALRKLIRAARIIDSLYIRQMWIHNEETKRRIESDTSAFSGDLLRYFNFNMGPWSRSDGFAAFLPGIPRRKPLKANLYPDGMKRNSWGIWFLSLNDAGQQKAMDPYYVVRWDTEPAMKVIPYSDEYGDLLTPIAELLREAATLCSDSTMGRFLRERAEAFLTNKYRESDISWLRTEGPLDVTIGPYDPTLDELFYYKTGFEAYIGIRNPAAEEQLASYAGQMGELASLSPWLEMDSLSGHVPDTKIRIADAVYIAGGGRAGYLAGALDLPVDTVLRREFGDKKVIFRNIQKLKFDTVQVPLAHSTIIPRQASHVTFRAYFHHMILHELLHSLGPLFVSGTGKTVTIEEQLGEMMPILEEVKADMAALLALQHFIDSGSIGKGWEEEIYTTHLSTMLRALRFGMVGAPGLGTAIEYNYLRGEYAFVIDPNTGLLEMQIPRFRSAALKLLRVILALQADGNRESVRAFFSRYAFRSAELEGMVKAAGHVPYAIDPVFPQTD